MYHRWTLTVLSYPRNMAIYHNPLFGVICMVIFQVIIIKITLNYSQIITLHILGSLPIFMHLREFIYKFNFPEHYPIVREEMSMFSLFWYHVSDRNNDFWQQLYGNYYTQLYESKFQCSHYLVNNISDRNNGFQQ